MPRQQLTRAIASFAEAVLSLDGPVEDIATKVFHSLLSLRPDNSQASSAYVEVMNACLSTDQIENTLLSPADTSALAARATAHAARSVDDRVVLRPRLWTLAVP